MKSNPKLFFNSPAGKLVLLIIFMIVCWIFLIVFFSSNSAGGTWFPKEADMKKVMADITSNNQKHTTESAKLEALEALRGKYNAQLQTYWHVDRDGQPETELRALISDTTSVLDIAMTRLDNVRISSKISDELSYADLSFQFSETYEKILEFIAEIESTTPKIGWRNISISLDNSRNRERNNNNNTANNTKVEQKYRFDGTIRVIRYMPLTGTAKEAEKAGAAGTAAAAGAAATSATTQKAQSTNLTPPTGNTAAGAAAAQAAVPATPAR